MTTQVSPTAPSGEGAVQAEPRPKRERRKKLRQLVVDVCACGETLPHVFACPFTFDPEICS